VIRIERVAHPERVRRALAQAGAGTIGELDPAAVAEFAPRLWVVPPGGSLL
jgi:hypothetical protein